MGIDETACQSVAIAEPDYQYRRNPCRRATAPGDCNGMYTTVDDIRNQVITTKAGQVKLGDIAVIEKGT